MQIVIISLFIYNDAYNLVDTFSMLCPQCCPSVGPDLGLLRGDDRRRHDAGAAAAATAAAAPRVRHRRRAADAGDCRHDSDR